MELSSTLFTRVASGISRGQALWALLTLNEYETDGHLRAALVLRAESQLAGMPLSPRTRAALSSGKCLAEFPLKQRAQLRELMHAQRPTLSPVKRFVPTPSVNSALVRNRLVASRGELVAANYR